MPNEDIKTQLKEAALNPQFDGGWVDVSKLGDRLNTEIRRAREREGKRTSTSSSHVSDRPEENC